jgi:NMD protein affecting ribosome stability and mRNA decay
MPYTIERMRDGTVRMTVSEVFETWINPRILGSLPGDILEVQKRSERECRRNLACRLRDLANEIDKESSPQLWLNRRLGLPDDAHHNDAIAVVMQLKSKAEIYESTEKLLYGH